MHERLSVYYILVLLFSLVLSRSVDIDLNGLCFQEKESVVQDDYRICSNCGCLNLNSDAFLAFNEIHMQNVNYDNDMLFQLSYKTVLNELNARQCQLKLRVGTKSIDFYELSNAASPQSRNVIFNLVGVRDATISLQGSCDDANDDAMLTVTELSIVYLRQPNKYEFRPKDIPSVLVKDDHAPVVSSESEVLSDHITYSSRGDSKYVSEVLRIINSEECNLLGSSDAVLLNRIEMPSWEDATANPDENEKGVTVLCAIFTMESNHATKVRAITDTWGRKCTQFLAFSTVDDASIPSIHIHHLGAEEYRNMWQKTRAIWRYIYTHYRRDFDYFLLGGDDMYYVMENLYQYLNSEEVRSVRRQGRGVYLGRVFKKEEALFNSGGPGYLLDGVALELLVANLDEAHCNPNLIAPHEDLNVALCLSRSVPPLLPYNTIDPLDRQRFHPFTAGFHFTYQPSQHFPRLPMDHWYDHYDHHIRTGYECCSQQSIAFHFIWVSLMYEMHDYLYKCPQIAKDYYYGFYGETHYSRSIKVINSEEL